MTAEKGPRASEVPVCRCYDAAFCPEKFWLLGFDLSRDSINQIRMKKCLFGGGGLMCS